MLELLDPSDQRLNLRSNEISVRELSSDDTKQLLSDMRTIASGVSDKSHPDRRSTVGLSAPQLGVQLRIILVDLKADPNAPNYKPDLKFFVNPRIVSASLSESLAREGCWSTGDICGAVSRPDEITVIALDEYGKEFVFTSQNQFQSHIFQHEIDHLDGIRFPSRIRNPKYLHIVARDEFQNYRENWKTWDKLCPVEEWLKVFNGEKVDADILSK